MSIIADAAEAVPGSFLVSFLILGIALIPGLILAWKLRAYEWRSVIGPMRIPPYAEVWPVPVALVIAIIGWIGSATAYGIVISAKLMGNGATQPVTDADLMQMMSPVDFVILAAVTPIIGLASGVTFLRFVRPGALNGLGFSSRHLGRGVALGALAALFAVPFTFIASTAVEWLYRAIDFKHPAEHDLLKFMKEAPALWIQIAAVAAAVVIAPLVEEFIFRGLLQTSLCSWFQRFGRPPAMPASPWPVQPGEVLSYASPVVAGEATASTSAPAAAMQSSPYGPAGGGALPATADVDSGAPRWPHTQSIAPPGVAWLPPLPPGMEGAMAPAEPARPPAWPSWLAILLTSILFAIIHPLWTSPIIFALSLVIGYVYERTGNLWAAIALHAIFNTSSTTLYLLGLGQG